MVSATVLSVLLMAVSASLVSGNCIQNSQEDFRADENDCQKFHICILGQLQSFTCPQDTVYHDSTHTCVPAHSIYDTCTGRNRCPPASNQLVAHPTKCAQYYDCGGHPDSSVGWEGQLKECSFPLVFSEQAKKCVQFEEGICGVREEPLDAWNGKRVENRRIENIRDYQENQCNGHSHCVPCEVRFPTCRGRQDGVHPWAGRDMSPYYVFCQRQRVASTGMCQQQGRRATVFDGELHACVEQIEVPEADPQTVQQAPPQQQGVGPSK